MVLMNIKRYKQGPYDSLQLDDNGMYCMYEDIKHIAPDLKRYKFGHWGSVICCDDGYFVYYKDLVEACEKTVIPEDCPNCPNQGWYVVADHDGEPMQEQCRFCYTNPKSYFNLSGGK